jgi:hypothetical protein
MNFHKLQIFVLSLALTAILGCGGSQPTEEAAEEPEAAGQPKAETVFEEGFEAGDSEEWTATETPATDSQEDAVEDPDRP